MESSLKFSARLFFSVLWLDEEEEEEARNVWRVGSYSLGL
jgi:hypothetical protein